MKIARGDRHPEALIYKKGVMRLIKWGGSVLGIFFCCKKLRHYVLVTLRFEKTGKIYLLNDEIGFCPYCGAEIEIIEMDPERTIKNEKSKDS